jgi:hypothetical protein
MGQVPAVHKQKQQQLVYTRTAAAAVQAAVDTRQNRLQQHQPVCLQLMRLLQRQWQRLELEVQAHILLQLQLQTRL